MIAWWNGLELIQQIFAVFAIPATVILVIQTILLLLGMGSDHDAAAHEADLPAGELPGSLPDGAADAAGPDYDLPAGGGQAAESHDLPAHAGTAAYHDAGLRLFTVRGLIAFFAIGGWTGIALIDLGLHQALAGFLALAAGFLALLLVALLFRLLLGLQSSGNLDIKNAIGLVGEVYLRIPGSMQGSGKITLVLQERSVEIDAVTEQTVLIETGRQVQVVGRRGDRLIVRPLP